MDDEDRKIGMLIATLHDQRLELQATLDALGQIGAQLQQEVRSATKAAVEAALAELKTPIHDAGQALIDLQGLSLWRAAWQHIMVALVAMAIVLVGVWWYVPPLAEISARRTERDHLEAAIADLNTRGARMTHSMCGINGEIKRFCVLVPKKTKMWDNLENKNEVYVVPVGY